LRDSAFLEFNLQGHGYRADGSRSWAGVFILSKDIIQVLANGSSKQLKRQF
jgi:hypothetical protein